VPEWGRYGAQYRYLCANAGCGLPVWPAVIGARSIIDFTLPIERIGDKPARWCATCGRRHPVACNTRRRILAGWASVRSRAPRRAPPGGELYDRDGRARVWSVDGLAAALSGGGLQALVTPAGSQHANARPAGEPMHAVTGTERLAMVPRAGGQAASPREIGAPLGTITWHDRQVGLVLQAGGPTGSGRNARSTHEPAGTVMPDSHAALVIQNMAANQGRSTGEPAPPVTTGGNQMLVQDSHSTGAGPAACAAVPDAAAAPDRGLLVYNGMPGFVRPLGDTAGTITARDKQALLLGGPPVPATGAAVGHWSSPMPTSTITCCGCSSGRNCSAPRRWTRCPVAARTCSPRGAGPAAASSASCRPSCA